MNEQIFLGGAPVVGFGACPVIRPHDGIYVDGRRVIALADAVGVGALERRNPLPPGRYWIDVFASKEAAFQGWLQANRASVRVVTTESFAPVGDYEARVWRLFDVTAPVPWNGPGLPTIAGPEIKSAADTGDRSPPVKDPLDQIDVDVSGAGSGIKTVALWVGGAVVVIVVAGMVIKHVLPAASAPPRPTPPRPTPSPAYGPTR